MGKSAFWVDKSTISMVIVNSYVKLLCFFRGQVYHQPDILTIINCILTIINHIITIYYPLLYCALLTLNLGWRLGVPPGWLKDDGTLWRNDMESDKNSEVGRWVDVDTFVSRSSQYVNSCICLHIWYVYIYIIFIICMYTYIYIILCICRFWRSIYHEKKHGSSPFFQARHQSVFLDADPGSPTRRLSRRGWDDFGWGDGHQQHDLSRPALWQVCCTMATRHLWRFLISRRLWYLHFTLILIYTL